MKEKEKEGEEGITVEGEEGITVEVAYGTPEKQLIIPLRVKQGTSALEAARQSGIHREFPAIDLENDPMGIFSRRLNGIDLPRPGDYILQAGDRVEIYRPLLIDPKQARLERASRESRKTKTGDGGGKRPS